jgi:hypothetical protein
MSKHKLPCGPNGILLTPKNTMSSLDVLQLFIEAIKKKNMRLMKSLLVDPETFEWSIVNRINSDTQPRIQVHNIKPCTDTYIVTYQGKSNWIASLQRQYRPRLSQDLGKYKIPSNSLYWRINYFTNLS